MKEVSEALNRLSHDVIGAAIEAHRELGPGYLESIYEEALCIELGLRDIPFTRQYVIEVSYKNKMIGESRLDLLVNQELVVELKAVDKLTAVYEAQVLSYLKATNKQLGLLINFNVELLRDGIRRIILS